VGGIIYTYKTNTVNGNNILANTDKRFVYSDHLGSVDVITDAAGRVTHSLSFDPWGARRGGENWQSLTESQRTAALKVDATTMFARPVTLRGFTGHEMVDDMGIIHMNGRIYDSKLGRFLQADPHIDGAANTQGYNRYSYVHNNPLNATDPSGFFLSDLKKAWNKIRPFVGAIVGVVLAVYAPWAVSSWYGAMAAGAISGAAGAAATGGNILKGAVMGGLSAAAFYGVGSAFQGATGGGSTFGTSLSAGDFAAKVVAHGMVGGVMSVLQGGSFGSGFAAAGFTQAFSGAIDGIGGNKLSSSHWSAGNVAARVASAAVVGGTASVLSGGKFANGAITGAFSRAFNHEAHGYKDYQVQMAQQSAQYKMAMLRDAEKTMERMQKSIKLVGDSAGVINMASTAAIPVILAAPPLYPAYPFVEGVSIVSGYVAVGAQVLQQDWSGAGENLAVQAVSTGVEVYMNKLPTSPVLDLALPKAGETLYNGWSLFREGGNGN
jgi:RHS repeat-associated protein